MALDKGPEPVFEPVADEFVEDYYSTVRGFVRQEVIRARLFPFLEDASLALDYGGGDARDSIWLAGRGVDVDYWDNSSTMRSRAATAVAGSETNGSVRLCNLDPIDSTLPRYDMLMLHGVIQYLELKQAQELMQKLSRVTESGGLLSLATKNFEVVSGDEEIPGVKVFQNNLGLTCRAYSAGFLQGWLEGLGFGFNPTVKGVRCISDKDKRLVKEVPKADLNHLVAEELHWTTREDSIEYGQMLHVLTIKR